MYIDKQVVLDVFHELITGCIEPAKRAAAVNYIVLAINSLPDPTIALED
jgi:hypothetical protein